MQNTMEAVPTSPSEDDDHRKEVTLAELIFPLSDRQERKSLERFRVDYEAVHGPTDLTRRYTCIWPSENQAWLFTHETKRYFDGLPAFVQAYLLDQFRLYAGSGKLDTLPDEWIRLYVQRRMGKTDRDGWTR